MLSRRASVTAAGLAVAALVSAPALAGSFVVDLTHPIPTFKPMANDPGKPDLAQPWLDSKAIPSFGQQTVLSYFEFPTNQGHFDLGTLTLSEHHGTHMDTPGHFVNNAETQDPDNPTADKRKLAHLLGAEDLIGPIVLIDISGRVQTELDKNGGQPSPDPTVTDFSEDSPNVVSADDIAAISDKIDNGIWLVVHSGWSRFFFEGVDFATDPFVNGWKFPGLSVAAIDKLIEIEDQKGVHIGGIVSEVLGVETGENSIGEDDKWTNSWYGHVVGLQRGWKFVENATNLELLTQANPDSCTVIVGALKHTRGGGGPARVMAMCEN